MRLPGTCALAIFGACGLAACDDMSRQPKQVLYAPVPAHVVEFGARVAPAPPLTRALLERGRERFQIYCTPCHSALGDGQGMIVQRGFPAPPSYHSERLRQASVQHFVDVMTSGYGAMYSFADRVQPQDRWAIAAYIRALQRSQHATAADLSAAGAAEAAGARR